ncbi:MAG: hypothetical protein HC778_07000 [Chamaesiphon sp. CSU_1_12]|nr:hypothetical protein [Chamaesiphon sp. CSU_1_12]
MASRDQTHKYIIAAKKNAVAFKPLRCVPCVAGAASRALETSAATMRLTSPKPIGSSRYCPSRSAAMLGPAMLPTAKLVLMTAMGTEFDESGSLRKVELALERSGAPFVIRLQHDRGLDHFDGCGVGGGFGPA